MLQRERLSPGPPVKTYRYETMPPSPPREISDELATLLSEFGQDGAQVDLTHRGRPVATLMPRAEPLPSKDLEALFTETERLFRLGHWEWDEVEDRCLYCSPEFARLHGTTVEDFLRRVRADDCEYSWVHPDDREHYDAAWRKLEEAGDGCDVEYRLLRTDGTFLPVREVANAVFAEDGALARSFGFVQDLTNRSAGRQDLTAQAHLLHQVAELANLGYWVWDEVTDRSILCSATLARMLGTSVEQYKTEYGRWDLLLAALHPDDRADYVAAIDTAFDNLAFYDISFRATHVDGGYRHYRERGAPLLGVDGRVVRSIGTLQDITEEKDVEEGLRVAAQDLESQVQARTRDLRRANRLLEQEIAEHKRAEGSLRASEKRYRNLFDESPLPILEEDWSAVKVMLDGLRDQGVGDLSAYFRKHADALKRAYDSAVAVGVSEAAVELYRAPGKEQLISFTEWQMTGPDTKQGYAETLAAFFAGAQRHTYESNETAMDGSPLVVRIRAVLPSGHREDWSRVLISIEDITDYRAAEERLRQAQKMEVVGQLTGGVAHDFNNLLAIIQGNAELLAERTQGCDGLIRPIIRAAERGGELTHGLLAFSRRQPLIPQAVEVAVLMDDMLDILRRTLGETIEVVFRASPDLWCAMADPGQLQNALLNLAVNARDAMPDGGRLTVACQNLEGLRADGSAGRDIAAGDYVAISVSDTGCGMTAAVREHAFEPFFTTKEVRRGSGLGLSMVYGFAMQSGGDVRLASELRQGTTVTIFLPRAETPTLPAAAEEPEEVAAGQGELILVIEDDPDVRGLAERSLKTMGYDVLAVADAAAAWDALTGNPTIALVLCDVVLPGGTSGPAFAREMQAAHPDMPVIFMSGYLADEEGRDASLRPDQVLLNKPFQRSVLAKALRWALG